MGGLAASWGRKRRICISVDLRRRRKSYVLGRTNQMIRKTRAIQHDARRARGGKGPKRPAKRRFVRFTKGSDLDHQSSEGSYGREFETMRRTPEEKI
jgi:hypothetical protein